MYNYNINTIAGKENITYMPILSTKQ